MPTYTCTRNDNYEVSLTIGKIYIPIKVDTYLLLIMDDTNEEYWFPVSCFTIS